MRVRILLLFVMCFSAPTFATSTNDDDEARRECDAHKRFSDFLVSSTTGSVTVCVLCANNTPPVVEADNHASLAATE